MIPRLVRLVNDGIDVSLLFWTSRYVSLFSFGTNEGSVVNLLSPRYLSQPAVSTFLNDSKSVCVERQTGLSRAVMPVRQEVL